MDLTSHEDIQAAYVAELRELQPGLMAWWMNVAGLAEIDDPVPAQVALRWPTGYSGHPRVLAVFRKYFFMVEDLNDRGLDQVERPLAPVSAEELWLNPEEPEPVGFRRPVDLLIRDIERVAPDLHKLTAGIVFVPVGLNQYDDPV
jgi:hypothetical protein